MPIKINRVKVFLGNHTNVVSEYYQVIGIEKVKFNQTNIVTVQEGKDLPGLLETVQKMGVKFAEYETRSIYDVYVPR